MNIVGDIFKILHVGPVSVGYTGTENSSMVTNLINMLRSTTKSQWSRLSTSATPQGYTRPRTFLLLASTIELLPTTANGILS